MSPDNAAPAEPRTSVAAWISAPRRFRSSPVDARSMTSTGMLFATTPMRPTTRTPPPETAGGSPKRRKASKKMPKLITTRARPFTSAARISARRQPKVRAPRAGRPAAQAAPSASAIAAPSETLCTASAISARLLNQIPVTIWTRP